MELEENDDYFLVAKAKRLAKNLYDAAKEIEKAIEEKDYERIEELVDNFK